MGILVFFYPFVAHAALNDSILDLNYEASAILGMGNESFLLYAVLANVSLENGVSISVALLNNTLENCLEIHYFEYSSDWKVELAHSKPLFEDLVWIKADKVERKILKKFKFSYDRFGVVSGRTQSIEIFDNHGQVEKVWVKEYTVYFDKVVYKFSIAKGTNDSFFEMWPVGKTRMKDWPMIYLSFVAGFLFMLKMIIICICCHKNWKK
jgi:hypothetical protein